MVPVEDPLCFSTHPSPAVVFQKYQIFKFIRFSLQFFMNIKATFFELFQRIQKCQMNGRFSQNWFISSKYQNFDPKHEIPKNQWKKLNIIIVKLKKKYCLKMPYFFWIDSGLIHLTSKNTGRWNNGYSFIKDFTQCVAGQIECIKIQPQSKNSPSKLKENPESTQDPIYIDSLK